MMDVKQFKLSSSEEIICEVLEWPDLDDMEQYQLVVRNVLKIVPVNEPVTGNRYYTFRPWIVFQDEPNQTQLININHIIGEAIPSAKLLEQFMLAVKIEDTAANESPDQSTLEVYADILKDVLGLNFNDSDQPKVIPFPNKGRLN